MASIPMTSRKTVSFITTILFGVSVLGFAGAVLLLIEAFAEAQRMVDPNPGPAFAAAMSAAAASALFAAVGLGLNLLFELVTEVRESGGYPPNTHRTSGQPAVTASPVKQVR